MTPPNDSVTRLNVRLVNLTCHQLTSLLTMSWMHKSMRWCIYLSLTPGDFLPLITLITPHTQHKTWASENFGGHQPCLHFYLRRSVSVERTMLLIIKTLSTSEQSVPLYLSFQFCKTHTHTSLLIGYMSVLIHIYKRVRARVCVVILW